MIVLRGFENVQVSKSGEITGATLTELRKLKKWKRAFPKITESTEAQTNFIIKTGVDIKTIYFL